VEICRFPRFNCLFDIF